jgi:hypothetical protein
MVLKQAREGNLCLIQVFQKGFDTSPTLKYLLIQYELSEGMLTVIDPKTNLPKSFPSAICTVDEVLQ